MVDTDLFDGVYQGRRVVVTGHRGFKGSWLVLWLQSLGAEVLGISKTGLDTEPSHFKLLGEPVPTAGLDIRDRDALVRAIVDFKPDIVFHLAAQPLVRRSYEHPLDTFDINIMGSLNVYHACRLCDSVRAIVSITSDKVYDNVEQIWRYREIDPLGGKDPYSASKGAAEIVTASYRHSFFHPEEYGRTHQTLLATARAGNVIGGGDWSADRLIPDAMKATHAKRTVVLRNPRSVRPWQHVLDALHGYLQLGVRLLQGETAFADAFNFGPMDYEMYTVEDVVRRMQQSWDAVTYTSGQTGEPLHEANLLTVDSTKAMRHLNWRPVWDTCAAIDQTVAWYRDFYCSGKVNSMDDLAQYAADYRKQRS